MDPLFFIVRAKELVRLARRGRYYVAYDSWLLKGNYRYRSEKDMGGSDQPAKAGGRRRARGLFVMGIS